MGRLFVVPCKTDALYLKWRENMENIIFGIMVVIALGAGVFTCIYEVGGSQKANVEAKNSDAEKGTNEL